MRRTSGVALEMVEIHPEVQVKAKKVFFFFNNWYSSMMGCYSVICWLEVQTNVSEKHFKYG